MKKTLIALMALAGVASAALTKDSTLTGITDTANNSYSWTTDTSNAAITLILSDSAFNESEGFGAFVLTGGKLNDTNINYVAVQHKTDGGGFQIADTNIGTAWGENLMGTPIAESAMSGAAWSAAKYAALTFAINSQGETYTLLSVIDSAGTITNIGAASIGTNVSFTGISGIRLNKHSAVSEAYIYSGSWTTTDLATVTSNVLSAKVPAIPEPATATLSLLALAGLAARRRRK